MPHRLGAAICGGREGWRTAGAAEAMAALSKEGAAGPDLARHIVRYAGWDKARARRHPASGARPAGRAQRRGRPGGVPHAGLPGRSCAMIMPAKRHRHSPAHGASPHGIGIVALGGPAKGGGRTAHAETGLRGSAAPSALIEAHKAPATAAEDSPPGALAAMGTPGNSDTAMYERVMKASSAAGARFRLGAVAERPDWKDGRLDAPRRGQAAKDLDRGVDIAGTGGLDDPAGEPPRAAAAI